MENKKIKRHEFIEKSIHLFRKAMEKILPKEDNLDEFSKLRKKIVNKIF